MWRVREFRFVDEACSERREEWSENETQSSPTAAPQRSRPKSAELFQHFAEFN